MESEVEIVTDHQIIKSSPTSVRTPKPPPSTSTSSSLSRLRTKEAEKKYGRGRKIPAKSAKDKKLRHNLLRLEGRYKDAVLQAKDAEILLENEPGFLEPEGELERSYKARQDFLKEELPVETARKGFSLKLEGLGPYLVDYTCTGRSMLLAGRKGHVAAIRDWRTGELGSEMQLNETVFDAKFLHNNSFFALAQKKYTYIYDHAGVELKRLQDFIEMRYLEFLPHHFLLSGIGSAGYLKWTDTSTGKLIAEMNTRNGTPTALGQNPSNAVLHCGHQNGQITLWSPNSTTPLVKLLAHKGPVRDVAVDRVGTYMVSTGQDCRMAVWDIRMLKEKSNYFLRRPGSSLAVSDGNLVASSWGSSCTVWKGLFDRAREDQEKVQSPYLAWGGDGRTVERLRWCPYEDVLGISHDHGFDSILVPGAGEANFDALEVNPYETTRGRQETEVRALLNKLQPEMISLNPDFIGKLDLASAETRRKEQDLDRKPEDPVAKLKNKGKGKNSSLRKYLRKKSRKNVIDETRLKVDAMRMETNKRARPNLKKHEEDLGPALARFAKKAG